MSTLQAESDRARVIRVALTHPLRAWVEALSNLLEPRWDIDVVVAHTSPQWARHAVTTGRADLLLTYCEAGKLPPDLPSLFEANAGLQVVLLSEDLDSTTASTAIRDGVRGWVEPTASADRLVRVLRGVARGESWIPPTLLTGVLDELLAAAETRVQATTVLSTLSAREHDVLRCLAQGYNRQQIAERYFLSPHTVRTHINNLLRKLDVHTTLAAVSVARQCGLADAVPQQRRSAD
jgi:DNA-binding NarL/FixJ family response regulator